MISPRILSVRCDAKSDWELMCDDDLACDGGDLGCDKLTVTCVTCDVSS
jgi:hypothetical protein